MESTSSGNFTRYNVTASVGGGTDWTKSCWPNSKYAHTYVFNNITGKEVINVTYHNIGTCNGRTIGLKLRYSNFVPTVSFISAYGIGNYPVIQVMGNVSMGYAMNNIRSFNINQSFFYEDTGSPADIEQFYMDFNSMNIGEGIVINSSYASTYRTNNSLVGKTATNTYEGLHESASNDEAGHPLFHQNSMAILFNGNSASYRIFTRSLKFTDDNRTDGYKVVGAIESHGYNSDLWNGISFSPLGRTAPMPTKEILNGSNWDVVNNVYNEGELIKFRINQPVQVKNYTGIKTYSTFSFSDVLPEGVTYKNAYVQKNGTTIGSSNYTLNYNTSNRTVTASFTSDYLQKSMSLVGETYSLVIEAIANSDAFKKASFTNQASTTIMGNKANTNTVKISPKCHITTEVENGVIDASINNITPGTNKTIHYSGNDGYMIKSIIVDGEDIDCINHFDSYTFSDINANHHIKVVYEKIPTINLTVVKEWDDTNNNDGFRPSEITVNFIKNNIIQERISLNTNNEWRATKTDLKLYTPRRELIIYDWSENMDFTNVDKYTQNNKTTTNGITTFTNTHELEKVESKVTLYWEDTDNNDGYRPDEVKVILYKNNEEYKQITVKKDQNWEHLEQNLLKYSPIGELNTYYWKEVEDYINHEKYEIIKTEQKGLDTEITNYHELERVNSTVTKVWDDENNNDGFRPSTIYASLYQDNKVIKDKIILNDGNKYKHTEYALLKYHNQGVEYQYRWDENTSYINSDKYVSEKEQNEANTIITNKHELEKVEVHVQKVWEDNNNHDKLRPSSIQVNLLGNGKVIKTVTLSEKNSWKTTITDLNKYEKGKVVNYTFEEPVLYYDYESTVETNGYETVITNTRDLTKTSRTVKKEWNDNNNQDQMRPSSIQVELLVNGEVINNDIILNEENNWETKITDLDYKDNSGEIIQYEFREKNIPEGYKVSYNTNGKETIITNTYTSEKTTATVKKEWDDNNNQDGIRPTSVEMRLYANGERTNYKVTLNERNSWTDGIANLDKYKNGEIIQYSFKEEDGVTGYKATSEQNGNLTIITNHYIPETTIAKVKKVWEDDDNADGIRPSEVTVILKNQNGVVLDKEGLPLTVILNETNNWEGEIQNLPKYKVGEEQHYYYDLETSIPDYTSTNEVQEPLTTITSIHTRSKVNLKVIKEWDDSHNVDNLRPEKVQIKLYANEKELQTITLSETNNWTELVSNLNKNEQGKEIEYRFEEDGLPIGYSNEIEVKGNETIITNTHKPNTTSVTIKKEWEDNYDADGLRPKSIRVKLLGNNKELQTIILSETDNWKKTINNLPLNENGNEINYSFEEITNLKEYTSKKEVKGSLTTITNIHKVETVNLKITKEWNDNNNCDKKRPEEIIVNLLADDTLIKEIILNSENNWTQTISDLPKNKNGAKINYKFIEQQELKDYQTTYKQKENETIIINTYKPESVTLEVQKEWIDNDNKDKIRPSEVVVILMKNNNPTDIKLTLNESNNWYGQVEKQSKYEDGKEFAYRFVLENEIDKYKTTCSQDGYKTIITSQYNSEEVQPEVQIIWDDLNNQYQKRPDKVIVKLYIDGEPSDIEAILKKENNWYKKLEAMPKYKDGKEIEYKFVEEIPEKYKESYNYEGIKTIITNYLRENKFVTPEETSNLINNKETIENKETLIPKEKIILDDSIQQQPKEKVDGRTEAIKTDDFSNIYILISLIAIILVIFIFRFRYKRK